MKKCGGRLRSLYYRLFVRRRSKKCIGRAKNYFEPMKSSLIAQIHSSEVYCISHIQCSPLVVTSHRRQ